MDDKTQAEYYGLTEEEVSLAYELYGPQRQAALALVEEKGVKEATVEELLAASSLGSPLVMYLRSQCPPGVVDEIRARLEADGDE